jgi:hypothetical protein
MVVHDDDVELQTFGCRRESGEAPVQNLGRIPRHNADPDPSHLGVISIITDWLNVRRGPTRARLAILLDSVRFHPTVTRSCSRKDGATSSSTSDQE